MYVAPAMKTSAVFAFVNPDSATIKRAAANTMTSMRKPVAWRLWMMEIGTRRSVTMSQATEERASVYRTDARKMKI